MSRTDFCLILGLGLLAVPSCTPEESEVVPNVAEVEVEPEIVERFQAPAVLGSLVFEHAEVDLGDVLQHHEYEVRYPFSVMGEGAVRIQEMDTHTGFTDSHFEPSFALGEWMPLGTKGAVVVTFDAGRYKNEKATSVLLRGDFQSNRIELLGKAFVHPVFEMKPIVVQFGSIRKADLAFGGHSQLIEVTALKDFEILRWRRTPPGVSIEEVETVEELEGMEATTDGRVVRSFLVTPEPGMPEGRMSSSFIAETSLGVELEFMVNAEIIDSVRYSPSSRVAFGIFDQGKEKRRSVKVEAWDPHLNLPIPTVTIEGDAAKVMSAEVHTVTKDAQYNIVLNIGKHAAPGSYNGVLRISYPEASGVAPKEIMLNARIRSSR